MVDKIYDVILKNVEIAFDIGAHKGKFVEHMFRKGVKTINAFEPQPDAFKVLSEKFADAPGFRGYNYAIWVFNGTDTMEVCRQATTLSSMNPRWKTDRFNDYAWEDKPITVKCITLDTAISIAGIPDYIKIDVEGCESEVLSTLRVPINALSFEFDAMFLGNTRDCLNTLDSIGKYEFCWTKGDYERTDFEFTRSSIDIMKSIVESRELWGMIHARLI